MDQRLLCLIAKFEIQDYGPRAPNHRAPRLGPWAFSVRVVNPFGVNLVCRRQLRKQTFLGQVPMTVMRTKRHFAAIAYFVLYLQYYGSEAGSQHSLQMCNLCETPMRAVIRLKCTSAGADW